MNVRFLNPGERKKLLIELRERFGIENLPYLFLETGKQKIRAFSGSLSKEELVTLGAVTRIEIIGVYFARRDLGLRLSFDATQLLQKEIKERIIELTDADLELWMRGQQLETELEEGVYVVRHAPDFLGCAYSSGKKLFNYVPKERQIRTSVKPKNL